MAAAAASVRVLAVLNLISSAALGQLQLPGNIPSPGSPGIDAAPPPPPPPPALPSVDTESPAADISTPVPEPGPNLGGLGIGGIGGVLESAVCPGAPTVVDKGGNSISLKISGQNRPQFSGQYFEPTV